MIIFGRRTWRRFMTKKRSRCAPAPGSTCPLPALFLEYCHHLQVIMGRLGRWNNLFSLQDVEPVCEHCLTAAQAAGPLLVGHWHQPTR